MVKRTSVDGIFDGIHRQTAIPALKMNESNTYDPRIDFRYTEAMICCSERVVQDICKMMVRAVSRLDLERPGSRLHSPQQLLRIVLGVAHVTVKETAAYCRQPRQDHT